MELGRAWRWTKKNMITQNTSVKESWLIVIIGITTVTGLTAGRCSKYNPKKNNQKFTGHNTRCNREYLNNLEYLSPDLESEARTHLSKCSAHIFNPCPLPD
ncbi:hypothetical protein K501DRAFT_312193 [Backusella circina FSU 941]|nr:hypothetical protein K501DRAFT_312193 [Backusella circina FSU 941]